GFALRPIGELIRCMTVFLFRALRLIFSVVVSGQRLASAVLAMQEKRKRILGRRDLGVVSGGLEFATAIRDRRANLMSASGGFRVDGRRKVLEIVIKRIEQDQPS